MSQFPAVIELSSLDGSNGFQISGEALDDYGGFSVSSAGDINGDGFADLLVGAPFADPNGMSSGASYVVFGRASGFTANFLLSSLDGHNGFQINGEAAGDYSGISVSSAGNINGDGFADIIIGAYRADPNGSASGASYVVFGKASGFAANLELSSLNGSNGFQINGEAASNYAGVSVASAGDINGDGFADLIIGAYYADPNGTNSGSSYIVFGKAAAFSATLDLSSLNGSNGFQINGEAQYDYSGRSVASAGDVNGDGFADFIIGANGANPQGNYSGASYVVFGKATSFGANFELSSLNGTTGFQMNGEAAGDHSGSTVSSAGDVNGDGFSDLIVGSPNSAPSGAAYVVFGKASGFSANLDLSSLDGSNGFQISGEAAGDLSAFSVSAAGDVNGDGFNDVIVGAPNAGPNGSYSGASYVVFGKASGFSANLDLSSLDGSNGFQISGEAGLDYSGFSVSSAGDVNGDGFADLIVGALGADTSAANSGASYVVFGRLPDTSVSRTGTGASQTLAGGNFNDTLSGLGGNDKLFGNGGNDVLLGGAGNDYLTGGAGFDVTSYADASGGVSVNLNIVDSQDVGGGAGIDTLVSIEYLIGSNFGDTLIGNAINNYLSGSAGNDVLQGGAGDDYLTGGAGLDVASYADASGGVNVDLNIDGDQNVGGGVGTDALVGIEYLIGSNFGDRLIGNGINNYLSGGAGNDYLLGSAGDDYLTGGTGFDVASYADASGGVSVDLNIVGDQNVGGGAGSDALVGIEYLVGSSFGDRLIGNGVNNYISGGGGNDILQGGAGDDYLTGDAGFDVASYADASGGVSVDLNITGDQNVGGGAGTDALVAIEYLIGSNFGDTLIGNAINNYLSGGAGNDVLQGGAGDDYLVGGAGNDSLSGGTGADVFAYNAASEGGDTITDFVHGTDKIDLAAIDAGILLFQAGATTSVAAHSVNWYETGGNTVVQADVNGNATADFQITLLGTGLGLTPADFVL